MKKVLIFVTTLVLAITLAGCTKEVEVPMELPEIPEAVTMDDVDDYLGRPDVQYVDLRNFDDKMSGGYISGFEFIPFFDYLEASDILVRTNGWTFEAAGIKSQAAIEGLFNKEKTIFLMCGSGTRAGFVLDALESLGYENVINVGGIADYAGENKVLGDSTYNVEVQLPLPATVDMSNIDMYLGRNDVQYVDLRNFDDKMASGYIAGFEFIPFFDYLEYSDILVRTNGWTFEAAGIKSQSALEGLFDMDKTIFLMCGSGTRAGFVLDALESIGYTNVINVGGISNYDGDNKVLGDNAYNVEVPAVGDYTPGVYYGFDEATEYMATVVVGANGAIEDVVFDAVYHGTTKNTLDELYTMGNGETWKAVAEDLASFIVANQGWTGVTLEELAIETRHIIEIDQDNSVDGVAGVTIGVEGFVFAWNEAIAQASDSDMGVLATTIGFNEYRAYDYFNEMDMLGDNTFFGYEGGSIAIITTDGAGTITDVYLDAVHFVYGTQRWIELKRNYEGCEEYTMNCVLNDNGTPLDDEDDFYEVVAGKSDWWTQADDLEAAVLLAGGWDAAWTLTDGAFGADEVAGVSIGVENWKLAIEEAIAKIPTE